MPPAKSSWQKLTERSSRQGAITLKRPRAKPKCTVHEGAPKLGARYTRARAKPKCTVHEGARQTETRGARALKGRGRRAPGLADPPARNRSLAERKSANSAIVRPGLCVLADFAPSLPSSPIAARRPVRPAAAQRLSAADLNIQACFSSPVAMPMSISLLRWSTSSTGSKVALIRSETVMSSSSNCE